MPALLLLCAVLAASLPGQRRQYLFLSGPGQVAFELEAGIPVAGSDTVLVDGRLLEPGKDYRFAGGGRLLVLALPAERWSTVRASLRTAGSPVEARGIRLAGPGSAAPPAPESAKAATRPVLESRAELDVSGSKSVGFEIGGFEGSGLNQATRLVVSGMVEGVEVEAELSDQSSPIPAEGTTRQLDELDRIAIALRGESWSGSFGDVSLAVPQAALGRVERRAVGGLAEARFGPAQARLGYARPRGVSARVVFRGRAGVQGPYPLSPDGRPVPVVPGTERVWLDGERLARGWDADYTIDYATGELRFTNRRVLTDASRVEASCQFQHEAWQREDLVAGVAVLPGGVELAVDVLRESDDPGRSLSLELDEQDREFLASIGDDTARAWLDGGTPVEPGTGDYLWEPGEGFYRFVGADSGDFRVAFSYVGDSLGDYVYDDTLLHHRHVGDSLGDYVARVKVELPGRKEWVSGRAGFERDGVWALLSGTWLRAARNLLAPGGASADDGAAGAEFEWRPGAVRLAYSGAWRTDGVDFDGGDSAYRFSERWGGAEPQSARVRNELAMEYRPGDWLEAGAEAGILGTEAMGQVNRFAGNVRVGFARISGSRAGDETRLAGSVAPVIGSWEPRLEARFDGTDSARDTRVQAGLGVSVSEGLRAGAGVEYDVVSLPDGSHWTPDGNGLLTRADATWRSGERVSVRGLVGRQSRSFPGRAADDWSQWLGDLAVVALPVTGVRLQADVSQSHGVVQAKDEIFRFVGEGNGDFRRDSTSGRFYPDAGGDYERAVVPRSERVSSRDRAASLGLEMSAWRPVGVSAALTHSGSAADSGSSAAAWSGTGRLRVRALEPILEPQLGADVASSEDRTLQATGQASFRSRLFLELAGRSWAALNLVARADRVTSRRFQGSRVDMEEQGWEFSAEPVLGARLRLELVTRYADYLIASPILHPELGRFRLQSGESVLARGFTIGDRTRVRAELGGVFRWSAVEELPFEVALTRPLGLTPHATLTLTHVLSDVLTASAGYRFSDRPDRAADHSLTGELRAFF